MSQGVVSINGADHLNSGQYAWRSTPILPIIQKKEDYFEGIRRNPKLFVPADFDYSPFFEIVKYPIIHVGASEEDKIFWRRFTTGFKESNHH